MPKYFFVLFFLFSISAFAQKQDFKITGNIISSEDQGPLESATIFLEKIQDSSLVSYTISDRHGDFTLENSTSNTKLRLNISYIGFKTYTRIIPINKQNIVLDTINMAVDNNQLDAVVIESRAPITVKKDTLEFNVKSFKTKKDANVEDLLKLLPGVEVADDGSITVNGKPVNKILVNGKPFFGNDPTITTRNLTKEIIEKVQVVDTKTKSQAFTGEEGDDENKTINLTIKKENNKGVFGRVAGGAGTDKRYEFAGMFNRFNNDRRISVLMGGNNINSPGFSFGEIRKMFGSMNNVRFNQNGSFVIDGRAFGGGEGITTSKNGGLNYADKFGEKIDVSSDYFFAGSSSENRSNTERETFLPDGSFFTNSNSNSISDNESHSANMAFDIKVDSTLLININPSFRYNKSKTGFSRDEETLDENQTLTNASATSSEVENIGKNFSNRVTVTKRFGSNGAYLKFQMNNDISTRDTDDYLMTEVDIYGNNPDTTIRDQYTNGENKQNDIESSVNYNIPLIGDALFFNLGYTYSRNNSTDKQSTFDKDNNDRFTQFNSDLSTDFDYTNEMKRPEATIRFQNKIWSARVQTRYLWRTLSNSDFLRPQLNLSRDFEALEVTSNFRYKISSKSSFGIGYFLNNITPQLNQLQAFRNVSNPLNVIIGNPELKPTNSHSVYLSFNAFNFQDQTGFYSYLNGRAENNAIVRKTTVDQNFVRETTYANVNGNYSFYGSLGYSKQFKLDSLRTIKVNVGVFGNIGRDINFNNDIRYASKNSTITPRMYVTFNWKDVFEITPRYQLNLSKNTFDIDALNDRSFLYHDLTLSTATFVPKGLEWRNEIKYLYNPNVGPGFQKSSWFWNSTLAYSILKDKATITLKAYDILNQNTNARRTATQDYIQDSQSTVLRQYFMFGFSWKFNSLGKKGEVRDDVFYFH
ncbi:outer membrane beta-barrel protein [Gaetbulibacter aestuarii]|uniref:Outer membrane beta-barrel protein n=1 Tax=Gaetbulibacter aestuarii TaxID=1502358 RepID=A0ABW7N2L9_9FLAO